MTARVVRMGDRVSLHYRLECGGEEVASTFSDAPETFTLGSGDIDPRLEVLLLGLKVGDHTRYALGPGEAFGDRDEGLVQRLARNEFDPALNLQVGHTVDFGLPNGQILHGTILSVDDTEVQVDFNHPLAGLPVEFEVRVLAIEPSDGS